MACYNARFNDSISCCSKSTGRRTIREEETAKQKQTERKRTEGIKNTQRKKQTKGNAEKAIMARGLFCCEVEVAAAAMRVGVWPRNKSLTKKKRAF